MSTPERPPANTDLDELAQLEITIAQHADELMRRDAGQHSGRNFWEEAEHEIWSERLRSLEPALAG